MSLVQEVISGNTIIQAARESDYSIAMLGIGQTPENFNIDNKKYFRKTVTQVIPAVGDFNDARRALNDTFIAQASFIARSYELSLTQFAVRMEEDMQGEAILSRGYPLLISDARRFFDRMHYEAAVANASPRTSVAADYQAAARAILQQTSATNLGSGNFIAYLANDLWLEYSSSLVANTAVTQLDALQTMLGKNGIFITKGVPTQTSRTVLISYRPLVTEIPGAVPYLFNQGSNGETLKNWINISFSIGSIFPTKPEALLNLTLTTTRQAQASTNDVTTEPEPTAEPTGKTKLWK